MSPSPRFSALAAAALALLARPAPGKADAATAPVIVLLAPDLEPSDVDDRAVGTLGARVRANGVNVVVVRRAVADIEHLAADSKRFIEVSGARGALWVDVGRPNEAALYLVTRDGEQVFGRTIAAPEGKTSATLETLANIAASVSAELLEGRIVELAPVNIPAPERPLERIAAIATPSIKPEPAPAPPRSRPLKRMSHRLQRRLQDRPVSSSPRPPRKSPTPIASRGSASRSATRATRSDRPSLGRAPSPALSPSRPRRTRSSASATTSSFPSTSTPSSADTTSRATPSWRSAAIALSTLPGIFGSAAAPQWTSSSKRPTQSHPLRPRLTRRRPGDRRLPPQAAPKSSSRRARCLRSGIRSRAAFARAPFSASRSS